jgi:hypothetical protein
MRRHRYKLLLLALIPFALLAIPKQPPLPVLDCHEERVQAGVPVRRLSDGRITHIDVCGAADSADDVFRDIPYEAPR